MKILWLGVFFSYSMMSWGQNSSISELEPSPLSLEQKVSSAKSKVIALVNALNTKILSEKVCLYSNRELINDFNNIVITIGKSFYSEKSLPFKGYICNGDPVIDGVGSRLRCYHKEERSEAFLQFDFNDTVVFSLILKNTDIAKSLISLDTTIKQTCLDYTPSEKQTSCACYYGNCFANNKKEELPVPVKKITPWWENKNLNETNKQEEIIPTNTSFDVVGIEVESLGLESKIWVDVRKVYDTTDCLTWLMDKESRGLSPAIKDYELIWKTRTEERISRFPFR